MLAALGGATADVGRVWVIGLVRPDRAFDALGRKPAPQWGLVAVALRFGVTSLTTLQLLQRRRRRPFWRSYLPFLPTARYYAAERFFLPVFGLGAWLAMGGLGHVALRRMGQPASLAQVFNIVGVGMLIPMPPLWLWDWTMIARDRYRLPEMAISHTAVAIWEAVLFAVGFHRLLGVPLRRALLLGHALSGLYIVLANPLVR